MRDQIIEAIEQCPVVGMVGGSAAMSGKGAWAPPPMWALVFPPNGRGRPFFLDLIQY